MNYECPWCSRNLKDHPSARCLDAWVYVSLFPDKTTIHWHGGLSEDQPMACRPGTGKSDWEVLVPQFSDSFEVIFHTESYLHENHCVADYLAELCGEQFGDPVGRDQLLAVLFAGPLQRSKAIIRAFWRRGP